MAFRSPTGVSDNVAHAHSASRGTRKRRSAFLDLQSALSQVQVVRQNIDVNTEALKQTRERFEASVSLSANVVQAQESLASANLDYINSLFAHNLAKLSLARALGDPLVRIPEFLSVQMNPDR